ncbi:AAA family ATPase [Burkholderia vietnamiensis]|uniref:AAA family ATPase n=1 Tax=Burkholderia vietnamiensis TaxID=60552 RepID=UPI00075DBC0B|nr:AAA family ATPase [Burkholderia vietnamiensis]KVS13849.1 DNA primase [Burkholderia vietnamiensis]
MKNGHDDIERARSALRSLDATCSREDWVRAGMAAKAAGLSEDDFLDWSAGGANFGGERDVRKVWRSIKPDGGISAATLFHMAGGIGGGDVRPRARSERPATRVSGSAPTTRETARAGRTPSADLDALLDRFPQAPADHAYIVAKRGSAAGLRMVDADNAPTIQGHPVAGWLAVPVRSLDGELRTIQFIPPPGAGKKLNMPGASFGDGLFVVGELVTDGTVYVCEGIGQAWACARADYTAAAAVTFGAGRCRTVAMLLRERYPAARIVIVPDRGKETDAEAIARDIAGAWVDLPADRPANYDANDYEAELGADALADLLRAARAPEVRLSLDVAFADELPDAVAAPDELVQGLLTGGGGSVLYGDSNSGKTFFVIDMAAAIARGVPWMDRQTEPGLVVYLAAESPTSVLVRLQAYQRHHGVRVPNFAVTRNPINLFEGDADTEAVIDTVRSLEARAGQPVRLIVGDTLARLSAGANENAGQDMGRVIERFDRIRTESNAHFLLIHHAGKAVAAGARGWSGIRAAIDTEIEVTDSPTGRCAEVTKQRDLASKGERIGFRLDVVQLGLSKWGTPITSCVVLPESAPIKPATGKKLGAVEGAVLEFLRGRGTGAKKAEVVKHFDGRYKRGSVYRALQTLSDAEEVHETAGIVAFPGGRP